MQAVARFNMAISHVDASDYAGLLYLVYVLAMFVCRNKNKKSDASSACYTSDIDTWR